MCDYHHVVDSGSSLSLSQQTGRWNIPAYRVFRSRITPLNGLELLFSSTAWQLDFPAQEDLHVCVLYIHTHSIHTIVPTCDAACAMSFPTSIPLTPLFSTLGHVSAKAGLSPVLSLLLLLDLVTAAWTCLQFSLLVSAVTWGVIWAACAHAPTGRYSGTAARKQTGHGVGMRGGNVMLAGCLLLVGVCERASGVQSHWVKVCGVPSCL